MGRIRQDNEYQLRKIGYKVIRISFERNISKDKYLEPETLFVKENELPMTSDPRPLRFYDGKLIWRSSNMKLNVFDVIGKSVAEVNLESLKLNGKSSSLRNDLEEMTTFDVLIENAARTRYPERVYKNHLNVIPSTVDLQSVQFDKKVRFILKCYRFDFFLICYKNA